MSSSGPLDTTLGCAFVGAIVAALLYGISVAQVYHYFNHQEDHWSLRMTVILVMVGDTVHQALITHAVYFYTVSHWGDSGQLQILVRSLLIEVVFNGFTAFLVQSFLIQRIWYLSNGRVWLVAPISCLVIGELVCICIFTAMSLQLETYSQLDKLKYLSILVNALAAGGDILISTALCFFLYSARTGFPSTNRMVNRLMVFTVNTGLLTSLCALASMVSILVAGNTFLYIAFFFCIGRLYTNSLLATLNARKKIRGSATTKHCSFLMSSRPPFKNWSQIGNYNDPFGAVITPEEDSVDRKKSARSEDGSGEQSQA